MNSHKDGKTASSPKKKVAGINLKKGKTSLNQSIPHHTKLKSIKHLVPNQNDSQQVLKTYSTRTSLADSPICKNINTHFSTNPQPSLSPNHVTSSPISEIGDQKPFQQINSTRKLMLLELQSHSFSAHKSLSKTYKTRPSALVQSPNFSSFLRSNDKNFCSSNKKSSPSFSRLKHDNKQLYPFSPLLIKDPLLMYASTMAVGLSSQGFKTFSPTEQTFPRLSPKTLPNKNGRLQHQHSQKYVEFPPATVATKSKPHYLTVHRSMGDTIVGPSIQRTKALAAYHAQLNKGTFFNNRALVDFSKVPAWFTARDIYFNASNLSKRKKKLARIKVQGMRRMTEINAALIEAKEMEVEVETNEFEYHSDEDEEDEEDLGVKVLEEEDTKLAKMVSLSQKKSTESKPALPMGYKVMMIAVPKAKQLPVTFKNEVTEQVSVAKSQDLFTRDKRRNSSFSRALLGFTKAGTKKPGGDITNEEGQVYEVSMDTDDKKKSGVRTVVTEIGEDGHTPMIVLQEQKRRIRFSDQVEYSWFEYLAAADVAEVRSSMLHNDEMPTTPFAMASLTRSRGSFSWSLKGMMSRSVSPQPGLESETMVNETIDKTQEGEGLGLQPQEMYKLRPASKSVTSLVSLSNIPIEKAISVLDFHENAPSSLPVTRFLCPVSSAGSWVSMGSTQSRVYAHSVPRGLVQRDTASLHAVTRILSKSLVRSGQWSSGSDGIGGGVAASAVRFRKEVIRKKTHHFYIARVFRTNDGEEGWEDVEEVARLDGGGEFETRPKSILKVSKTPVVAEHSEPYNKQPKNRGEWDIASAASEGSDYPASIYQYYFESENENAEKEKSGEDSVGRSHHLRRPWRVGGGRSYREKVWWRASASSRNGDEEEDDAGFSFVTRVKKKKKKKEEATTKEKGVPNREGYFENCYCERCNAAYLQNHVEPYAEPVYIRPCGKHRRAEIKMSASAEAPTSATPSGGLVPGAPRGLVDGSKGEWEGKYLETNAPRMLEFMYYNWVFFGQAPPAEPQFV